MAGGRRPAAGEWKAMTPERWQEVDRLLEAALDRPAAERAAFLAAACAGDDELRGEVASLLAAHDEAGGFTARPPLARMGEMMGEMMNEVIAAAGAPPADAGADAPSVVGTTLGHYRITSLLGRGGMGEVYRARDLRLDREVAVKILPPRLANDPEALPRFEREAKAVAALSHPNILAIHDFGHEGGVHYAVMELLEGETLRARVSRGPLPWRQAARIAAAVADGLAAAHARGIIHRDLKPENVFLNADGQVKILDFGIARVRRQLGAPAGAGEAVTLLETTEPGRIIGTIGYMSPEQLRGEPTDAPSDIFSLGTVLFEMVAGERPFARESVTETMAAILRDEPPPLTGLRLDPEFERLVLRCLQKQPRERLQSAHDLALELRALASESQRLRLAPAPWPRPRRAAVAAAVALACALAALAYLLWPKQIDSLAVLPFTNASADPNAEYLSDGISESLINGLSQLPSLKVIARSSSFRYKGREADPQEVARALGVRAVVTGRIVQRGDRLLISVELTDAREKRHVWGEQYLRPKDDLLAVQVEISREIADKLRLKLTRADQQQLAKRETAKPEAYELLLKGRHLRNKGGTEDRKKAVEHFQRALELDPRYALAYAELGASYRDLVFASVYPPQEYTPRARQAVQRALELDPHLAEAHRALASLRRDEWDWAGAENSLKRALELNPNLAVAHSGYASFLSLVGRHDEALAEARRARELDPLSLRADVNIGQRLFFARRYDEAVAALRKTLELDANYDPAHLYLGYAYTEKGMFAEAVAAFEQVIRLKGDTPSVQVYLAYAHAKAGRRDRAEAILRRLQEGGKYVSPAELATVYAGMGDKERALGELEKAYAARDSQLQFLGVDPALDSLRAEPRFADLLRRVRLAP
jgi:eukaryotic-like serine/threonine-protein kinase